MSIAFRTDRLVVREFVLADAADAFALWSDPEVRRFTGDDAPSDEAAMHDDICRWRTVSSRGPGCGFWAAHAGDEFVGDIFVRPFADRPDEFEIGWHLARSQWGNGYATELARGALNHAHDQGVRRIVALIDPRNAASLRVAAKAGMACEGETQRYDADEPPVVAYVSERPSTAPLPS